MTLILGMSKPEGIYLSADYRVTDYRTGKLVDDESVKHITISYPPLPDGPRALLGYSGLAVLPDGTPTLTWIRQTLRGESEYIDQSMSHLRERLNRDITKLGIPLVINVLVIEKNNRRLLGGFSNVHRAAKGKTSVVKHFEYAMSELNAWAIFANGSGMQRLERDGHFNRLRPHLDVVPRKPMNHMNLLAEINRQVASKAKSVSPICNVSFLNADNRFTPVSHTFANRGESAPFEMQLLIAGLDMTEIMGNAMNDAMAAVSRKEIPVMPPQAPVDVLNERIKRRA